MRAARRLLPPTALLALVALVLACGSAVGAGQSTVWLCRPGSSADPCATNLDTTVIGANRSRSVVRVAAAANPKFDCFYIYPTVSTEAGANADLRIGPGEIAAAQAQAARFSTVCRVWAPMYRQETLGALLSSGLSATARAENVAYASLLSAWQDYLAHDNDGRPIVFLGHSQGAAMLIRLLASQVDGNASLRGRLVSAIILGGNVLVPTGRTSGGSFRNIPVCTRSGQAGCVIAYSSFPGRPPATSLFGIPGQGVSYQSGQLATTGVQVACVNPAAIGGGTGALLPILPGAGAGSASVSTPWVEFPKLYTAQCRHAGNATWLQINDIGTSGDPRPRVTETAGPDWGYHEEDVNIALANLVADVAAQERGYQSAHR